MKVKKLIEFLKHFNPNDEIVIEVHDATPYYDFYIGSYMKRGFARMFQVSTNLSSHVLYTVLCNRLFINILKQII